MRSSPKARQLVFVCCGLAAVSLMGCGSAPQALETSAGTAAEQRQALATLDELGQVYFQIARTDPGDMEQTKRGLAILKLMSDKRLERTPVRSGLLRARLLELADPEVSQELVERLAATWNEVMAIAIAPNAL